MPEFSYVPVDSIIIDKEARQRRDLGDIPALARSIRETNGLIQPIVLRDGNMLVAGERRLTAYKHLGWDKIPAIDREDLSEEEAYLIELEENLRRADLTWQERVKAISAYHNMKVAEDPEWSQEATAELLAISATHLSRFLLVEDMLEKGVPEIVNATQLTTAMNFAERQKERQKASVLRDLGLGAKVAPPLPAPDSDGGEDSVLLPPEDPTPPSRKLEFRAGDFLEFANEVQATPFNLIHCDFPYGVNVGDTSGYSKKKTHGGYADSADIYFTLLETLATKGPNFIAPSAHMIFWFSMDYYTETKAILEGAEWRVNPFPLIWHKTDNTGILPDPSRGPRRIYETAFLCTMGDRKIVKPVANVAGVSGARGDKEAIHTSAKSPAMLDHFFRMLVDQYTVMLDPTSGSGNAVAAAERAGAAYSLGLELNPDYVEDAKNYHL